ncbi:MAG: uracil-DNA glycosylase family protein [Hyphomicrobiaceae bacterium]|nr:uracil-DNA glycosylase family protein [Hyphomicrobiaceae bacterium]MCC0010071.1 uracil-DNA glycosylase family protein [Hyphomicrobiaceae bacterium]
MPRPKTTPDRTRSRANSGNADRIEPLDDLLRTIRACRVCRDAPTTGTALPHEPRPVLQADHRARLAISGQAPGVRVHASGRPFTDPSGDRLRDWMDMTSEVFYNPAKVAVIPMGFCFPGHDAKGGDLPPRRECSPLWREKVLSQLPGVELLLLVGQYAQRWHLAGVQAGLVHESGKRAATLTQTVRDWQRIMSETARPRLLPMPHPSWRNNSWLKANPWFEKELLPVLRAEVKKLTA